MLIFGIFTGIWILLGLLQGNFIFGGDSAEFSLVASTLSIPHAPGYPLYTLLGNVFVKILPIGTVPWKLSLISSFSTIFTGFLVYKILFTLTKDRFVSLFTSVFYIFIFLIWLYAIVPEVFALNNLIIALITYSCLWLNSTNKEKVRKRVLNLTFFLLGLSIANHHTFVLFLPGWFLLIKRDVRGFVFRNLRLSIVFLLLGSAFYLYAPFASSTNPPLDWENAKTLDGFIRLITRSSYGTFAAYPGANLNFISQIFTVLSLVFFILHDFRILGIFFILFGLFRLVKINNRFFAFIACSLFMQLLFIFATNFVLTSSFIAGVYERFLTFIYLTLIFPFGIGVWKVTELFRSKKIPVHHGALKFIVRYSIFVFLILFLVIEFQQNFQKIKRIKNLNTFEVYAKELLDTVPRDSILNVLSDTPFFTSYYIYNVEKYRNDIKFIFIDLIGRDYFAEKVRKQYPNIYVSRSNNMNEVISSFLKVNSEKHAILFEKPLDTGYWQPYGLLWKYYPTQEAALKDTNTIIQLNKSFWDNYKIPKLSKDERSILLLSDLQNYYLRMFYVFSDFLSMNNRLNDSNKYLQKILKTYDGNYKPAINLLLKNYTIQSKCNEASKYLGYYKYKPPQLLESELKLLVNYYTKCEPNNKILEGLTREQKKRQDKEKEIKENKYN